MVIDLLLRQSKALVIEERVTVEQLPRCDFFARPIVNRVVVKGL